ncbi:MAG: biopolymer transporter ExbD [Candidatus Dadabacteria bacterium]|nr:MAG: biopolymer transporter ExbD [Candidatus Dadabacteria bacterium]
MGMHVPSSGGKERVQPEINMTPLIDVVLVLLIVFMVITPMLRKQFTVQLPKQEKQESPPSAADDTEPPLVVRVDDDGQVHINDQIIPMDGFADKLRRVFAARDDQTVFFDAADDAPYGVAVEILDQARAAGAVYIAILTKRPAS